MNWHCATCFKQCIKSRAWARPLSTGTFLDNLHNTIPVTERYMSPAEACKLVNTRMCIHKSCNLIPSRDPGWGTKVSEVLPPVSSPNRYDRNPYQEISNAFNGIIDYGSSIYDQNRDYVNILDDTHKIFTSKPASSKSRIFMKMFITVTPFECQTCAEDFTMFGLIRLRRSSPSAFKCPHCGAEYDKSELSQLPRAWNIWDSPEEVIKERLRCLIL